MPKGGYMNEYLDINLNTQKYNKFDFNENDKRKYLGGYGIGCKYIYENQDSNLSPFDENNILGFMSGPMNGTTIPGSARFTVCGKSPLTGGWGDANCGGFFGPRLKKAGYDGIFIKGRSEKPIYIVIENGEVEFYDSIELWGKDTYETEDILKERYGREAEVVCIGQAGEKKTLIACISHRKGKVAGRSGLGALMGSKNLKAVIVKGDMNVPIADVEKVKIVNKELLNCIKENNAWSEGGTISFTEGFYLLEAGPIKNWSGTLKELGDLNGLSYENIKKYLVKKETCFGCPFRCWGKSMVREGKYTIKEPCHMPEFETAAMFGPLCLNTNFESIIKCNDICNRYGLDTISTGSTVAFAIECYEKGIIKKKDTDGLELTWGNCDTIVKLTEKIAKREGFGEILADGSRSAASIIGNESEDFAIQIMGQDLAAHDTRYNPSLMVIYALDPTPGRHTQAANTRNEILKRSEWFKKAFPEVDLDFDKGKRRDIFSSRSKYIKIMSNIQHGINVLGMCLFMNIFAGTDVTVHPKYLSAVTGWDVDFYEFNKTGERIMNLRQVFNNREGIIQIKNKVPKRILGIPPLQDGNNKNIVIDFNIMAKEFYKEMDWDVESGKPSEKKLKDLELEWMIS